MNVSATLLAEPPLIPTGTVRTDALDELDARRPDHPHATERLESAAEEPGAEEAGAEEPPTRYEVPIESALAYLDGALARHAETEARAAAIASRDAFFDRWHESLAEERRRLERIRRRLTGEAEPEPTPVLVAKAERKRDRARHIAVRAPAEAGSFG